MRRVEIIVYRKKYKVAREVVEIAKRKFRILLANFSFNFFSRISKIYK